MRTEVEATAKATQIESQLQEVVELMAKLPAHDSKAIDDLQHRLQSIQTEQEHLKAELFRLEQQLAFYNSFEKLLYDMLKQPVAQVMDFVRLIGEQAQAEAERIVQEAEAERGRLLSHQLNLGSPNLEYFPATGVGADQPELIPPPQLSKATTTVHVPVNGQTELVIDGFKTFGRAVEFQKSLQNLPEINYAKVRLAQKGTLNLDVSCEPEFDLVAAIEKLPKFKLHLVASHENLVRFMLEAVQADSSSNSNTEDAENVDKENVD